MDLLSIGFAEDDTPYPDLHILQAFVSTLFQIWQGKSDNHTYLHSFLLERLHSSLTFNLRNGGV